MIIPIFKSTTFHENMQENFRVLEFDQLDINVITEFTFELRHSFLIKNRQEKTLDFFSFWS